MIRTKAGKEVGWLDEEYFWNGEDLDFCYKLKLEGWKILYLPETKIIHYKGSASGLKKSAQGRVDTIVKRRSAQSSTKVMRIFYNKHLSKKYHPFLNWIVNLGINFMEVFRIAKSSI